MLRKLETTLATQTIKVKRKRHRRKKLKNRKSKKKLRENLLLNLRICSLRSKNRMIKMVKMIKIWSR